MRTVLRGRLSFGFSEEVKKEKRPAFMTEELIRESVEDEELQTL